MSEIDLNSDLGEGMPVEVDDAMLALASSANVACGGHAGDETSMRRTVARAAELGVRVGAHPSYPDREGFGRLSIPMEPSALRASIVSQVSELRRVAEVEGVLISYVKPHGALYNDAAKDPAIGDVVVWAAAELGLPLMTLAGSPLAARDDIAIIAEGFLDRAYRADGSLVPRTEPGALLTDAGSVAEQALRLAGTVASLSLHSDTPGAVDLMRAARARLERNGYTIRS